MVRILAILFLVAAWSGGCDSNFKVKTTNSGLNEDCLANPNATPCQDQSSRTDAPQDKDFQIELVTALTNSSDLSASIRGLHDQQVKMYLSTSADCEEQKIPGEYSQAETITFKDIPEGTYYVCAFAQNGESLKPATNNGLQVVFDRTPPILDSMPVLYKNAPFTLAPNLAEPGVKTTWSQNSGPGISNFSASWPTSFTLNSDGGYEFLLTATDAAGNTSTQTYQVVYDTVPPTVNAGADIAVNTVFNATASVSETSTLSWMQMSGPGTVTFGDDTSLSTSIAASNDGAYVLRLTATDAAGNTAYDDMTVYWITSGPQFISLVKTGVAADGYINDAEKSTTSAIFTLNATAYDSAEYSNVMTSPLTCDATVVYGHSSLPGAADVPADGSYGICVHLSDLAGNHVYASSEIIQRDTTFPAVTTFNRVHEASDGYVNGVEISSTQALVDLVGTGFATAAYSNPLNNGALTCDAAKAYSNSAPPAVNALPAANGAYAVCAKLADVAGNIAYEKSMQIVVDIAAPTVNAGADIVTSGSANIDATSAGGTSWQWSKVSGPGSISFGSPNAEDTTAVASIEGTYTLRLTVTDDAGNSAFDELDYTYDATPPTLTSLTKTGGAADGYINNAEKTGNTALWVLNASAYTDVFYSVPLDETTPQVCDASRSYTQTSIASAADLPNTDAPYVICVRLRDAANNATYGKSEVVTRDTVLPTVNVGSDLTIHTTASVNATVSGASNLLWSKVSGSGTLTFSAATAASTDMSANADDTYVVRLTATDAAGNSASDDLNLIWDATPPVFTSLVKTGAGGDGYINDAEKNGVAAIWTLSATGYTVVNYTTPLNDSTPVTCNNSLSYSVASPATAADLPSSDLPYIICVDLSDAAGNHTYGKSEVIIRDIVAPSVNVGSDISTNTTVSVAATVSGASTLLWTKTSGTGSISFSAPTAATTDVSTTDETTYVLRLTATDAAGNSAFDELNFLYSTTVPSLTSFAGANQAADGYVNNAEKNAAVALLSISASNYVTINYTSVLADSSLVCDASKTYDQSSIPLINAMPAPDGLYAVCVKLVASGGGTTYGKSQSIVKDTTAPSVNAGADVTAGASAASLTGITSGAATWLWSKQSGTGTVTFSSATTENTTASASAEEAYTLRLTATDTAGNSAFDDMILTWDTTPPSFTSLARANEASDGYINSAELSATNPLWTLTASGQVTTDYTTALDDTGAAVVCNAAKTYNQSAIARATDIPASDKPYVICVRLTDSAGNITYGKSAQVTRDTAPAVFTSLNGANGASDAYINAAEVGSTSAMFTLSASGHASADYTVVLADSALTCDAGKTYNQASIPLINTTPASDGAYAVCARLTDAAGNFTYGKSQSIVRDTNLPTVAVGSDITSNAAANITPTVGGATTYAWTKQAGTGTITFGSPSAANTTATASGENTYTLRLTVTDVAGNTAFDELDYTYDMTAPVFTSLVRANEASDGYINTAEASAANPLWTLSASGQSATIYTAPLDDTGSAVTCDAGKTYSPTTIATAADLPAVDKPYVICVRLSDAAGNISYGKSAQVTRDTQAPTISSFVGANAASDGYINASETGSATAIVALSASGASTTNYTVILSNTGLTCDVSQTYGQSSIPLINTMTASDGAYAVCVKLVDVAGNTTYGKSQVITRDVAPPTVNVGADLWAKASTSINASTTSATSYAWSKQSGPGTITFGTPSAEDTTASSSAQGLHVLRLTATDAAGNSAYDELDFTWDTVAPAFTSLSRANGAADGYVSPADITANAAIVSSVVGSGYDDVIYQVFSSATTCSAATYTNSANTIPLAGTLSATADGTYKVCVKLTDLANNTPAYGSSSNFTIDKTAPAPGGSGEISTTNVNNVKVTLTWTAATDTVTPAGSIVYSVYYSTNAAFNTVAQVEAGTLITSSTNLTTATATGLSADTIYYFNVVVRDQQSNKTVYNQISEKTRDATFVQVDVGQDSGCGLTAEGKLYCWGNNPSGGLGTGNTTDSWNPVPVSTSLRFKDVRASIEHTCALSEAGAAYCWGNNAYGQLGTGNTTNATTPIAVNSSDLFKQIVVGYTHTCALRTDGAVYCWGDQNNGKLGNGLTTGNSLTPVAVSGGIKFKKLSASIDHTCGLSDASDMYCWGYGGMNNLGNGSSSDRTTPTLVSGGYKYRHLATGRTSTCGIRSDGLVYCWGVEEWGSLGNGVGDLDSPTPGPLSGGRRYRDVALGWSGGCAIDDTGDMYCWGEANSNGTNVQQDTPLKVNTSDKFRSVTGERDHYCAVTSKGNIVCMGQGWGGKLGSGNENSVLLPNNIVMTNVTGGSAWTKISGGASSACGLRSTGKVLCWGSNSTGQLGDGTTTLRSTATAINSSANFIDIAVGSGFACGIQDDGKIACFGDQTGARLGDGQTAAGTVSTPVVLTTAEQFIQISTGYDHACALRSDGRAVCWGTDTNGRLGNGSGSGDATTPTVSDATATYTALAQGQFHGCGIVDDGTVKCWGYGASGRLGTGNTTSQESPTSVTGTNLFTELTAGKSHTCGINGSGQILCWGSDTYGQLGNDATLLQKNDPTSIDSGNTYLSVGGMEFSTCGIRANGALYCWGSGANGRIGDGTIGTNRPTPTAVNTTALFKPGNLSGGAATYAVAADGRGYAWGDDTFYQLGNGYMSGDVSSPTPVLRKVAVLSISANATNTGAVANLIDNNTTTGWQTSGTDGWFELKLSWSSTIKRVQIKAANNSSSYTNYIYTGAAAAPTNQVWSLAESYGTGYWVQANISSGADDTRFVRVRTTSAAEAAGWNEVEVFE